MSRAPATIDRMLSVLSELGRGDVHREQSALRELRRLVQGDPRAAVELSFRHGFFSELTAALERGRALEAPPTLLQ